MKKKILSEVTISCDPPRVPYYIQNKGPEAVADYYESWIREFDEFIRDHRSQDPVSLNVEREYQDVCSHCGYEWDEDENGLPCCCDKAQAEYEEARLKAKEANLQHTTQAVRQPEEPASARA
jgi:hypothetical protein